MSGLVCVDHSWKRTPTEVAAEYGVAPYSDVAASCRNLHVQIGREVIAEAAVGVEDGGVTAVVEVGDGRYSRGPIASSRAARAGESCRRRGKHSAGGRREER